MASSQKLEKRIDQAMGREKADLVVKYVTVLNVATGETEKTDIAICDNTIVGVYETYHGKQEINGSGLYAVPGFIDTHVHVESSMITPMEFDRCVLPRGTTTAICDPHEISNVLGEKALEYFLSSSENTVMDLIVQLSSCVPATKFETSGAKLSAAELVKFRGHKNVIGLAEFMDIGGVLGKDKDVLAKLDAFQDGHIDGHMPGISGPAVNAMSACGIYNCHESTDLKQAEEKLKKGIQILIREGTVCKDLKTLATLIKPFQSPFLGFCTDDRNPLDIGEEGHIDHLIRSAIKLGADPASVYRIASWSAAQSFGLHKNTDKWQARGMIKAGFKADIVLLDSLEECNINTVIKNGRIVDDQIFEHRKTPKPVGLNSVKIKNVTADDFKIKANNAPTADVIGLIKNQIVTVHLQENIAADENGNLMADPKKDILKMAVLERHGKTGNIANCFVKGFGFTEGALASSIGHDSHNITVVGASDEDMALAVNRLKEIQGGFVVVKNGKVEGEISLPIAGLMSDKSFEEVRADLETFKNAVDKLNAAVSEPMMHMIFLPLCVIPTLKLTDFGLVRFDPANGDEGPVLIQDQRKEKAATS